ncbi:MAG TPA: MarR family transcriptional regulator [Gemmatimonadaceae bacterium]|nr:MarR family transcriptional regulator [Gemmatimonadaceae bacterium]
MKILAPGRKAEDVSGTHLWLVIMKAHRSLQRLAARSIEASEMGLSDFAVMEMLLHKGPQPVNEIGRRIELTSGAITTAVDRLESRGLVTREAHENDRRARIVRLTTRGQAHAAKVFAAHKAAMDLAGTALSKSERATLIQLLRKLGVSAASSAAPTEKERT